MIIHSWSLEGRLSMLVFKLLLTLGHSLKMVSMCTGTRLVYIPSLYLVTPCTHAQKG